MFKVGGGYFLGFMMTSAFGDCTNSAATMWQRVQHNAINRSIANFSQMPLATKLEQLGESSECGLRVVNLATNARNPSRCVARSPGSSVAPESA